MGGVNSKGFSNLTVTGTAQVMATACSPAMPDGAKGAIIVVETAPVRYREAGTAVSAAGSGHLLNVGDSLNYDSWTHPGNDWRSVLKAISVIRTTGTSGILTISWYD